MSNKKKYTQEFRQEAIKLVTEQDYSQAEASKRLGVPHANLSRWIKESNDLGISKQGQKKVIRTEQKELEALRKENKRLKLEREILKKAAAFFANEKN
jgi:transposase